MLTDSEARSRVAELLRDLLKLRGAPEELDSPWQTAAFHAAFGVDGRGRLETDDLTTVIADAYKLFVDLGQLARLFAVRMTVALEGEAEPPFSIEDVLHLIDVFEDGLEQQE